MSTENKTLIHWYRNDLRTDDHRLLNIEGYKNVFGVYILDQNDVQYTKYGFRKMGLNRLYHLRESLVELQSSLRENGSELLVKFGETGDILKELTEKYNADLSFQKEYGTEEIERETLVQNLLPSSTKVICYEDGFLVPTSFENEISKNNFPRSFSGFRKIVENKLKEIIENTPPITGTVGCFDERFYTIKPINYSKHQHSAFPLKGGCKSAEKHLNDYFFKFKSAKTYKETRNYMLGTYYSTKFSPYLANGAVSPRKIMYELKIFEERYGKNKSTYWIWFELLWRDYFRHAMRYYGRELFLIGGLNNKKVVFKDTKDLYFKWILSQLPSSFVNANMVELKLTGFMSNRGRQNVASYLVHDLNVDWRKGAAWFEHCLIDYDVSSNQGNWLYIVGNAFNSRGGSKFNIDSQQEKYDPNREFTDLWINDIKK